MIRVIALDPHPVVLEGIKQILAGIADLRFVAAANGEPGLSAVLERNTGDVLVLDINSPDAGGLLFLHSIKESYPGSKLLIFSGLPEREYAIPCLRAGAAGYLTKNSTSSSFVAAIRKVAAGGRYISGSVAEQLLSGNTDLPPQDLLSPREYQILTFLGNGKTVTETAVELSLSVKTVSTYRSRILEKLQLTTTSDLIRYAIRKMVA